MSAPLLVVAIDIGTTYSGYAFCFRHDISSGKPKISTNKLWRQSDSQERASYKTPTAVLINPRGQFDSFGYEAEEKYSRLGSRGEHKSWLFFKRFKMSLYETTVSRHMKLQSVDGHQFDAVQVFSMAIRYLKDHFHDTASVNVRSSEIKYVLTVPAIWNEEAKKFMREAGVQAGISTEQLCIALEPEAASVFCQSVLDSNSDRSSDLSLIGTRYIVVDAGGGTVDTTVHEVTHFGKLKELHRASGGGWGGTQVDDQFTELLLKVFTPKVMKEFGKDNKPDWLELEKEFELAKRRVSSVSNKSSDFVIPVSLRDTFSRLMGQMIKSRVQETDYAGQIRFIGDKMRVDSTVMQSLFQPTCQKIVDHVSLLLRDRKCRGVSHILLVGGFAESPYLQEMFQREFPSVNIVTPPDAVLSVMKGAVIFGHTPERITSRVCSFTYGIEINTRFVRGKHDLSKWFEADGDEYCRNKFSKFVTAGQEVRFGERSASQTFRPIYRGQTSMSIPVYRSTDLDPMYTTDPSCSYVGEFTVLMPDLSGGKCREVDVHFVYGGTELTVKAHEKTTGKHFESTFDFEHK